MNIKFPLSLVIAAVAFTQPVQAAAQKNAEHRETLVAALQAVSPDALGGRLGLNLATPEAPKPSAATPSQARVVKASDRSADQLAYLSWKSAKKS